jgi:two-component system response regulator
MDKMTSMLLVEDNEDDIDLTLLCLKKNHIVNQVDVVRDGAEALDYLYGRGAYATRNLNAQPAVILLDLNLPKVSGLEVLAKIRSEERTKKLPVVIFTTSNMEKDITSSYDSGANSYVRKPVDLGQFNDAIRQLGLYWVLLNEAPPSIF